MVCPSGIGPSVRWSIRHACAKNRISRPFLAMVRSNTESDDRQMCFETLFCYPVIPSVCLSICLSIYHYMSHIYRQIYYKGRHSPGVFFHYCSCPSQWLSFFITAPVTWVALYPALFSSFLHFSSLFPFLHY